MVSKRRFLDAGSGIKSAAPVSPKAKGSGPNGDDGDDEVYEMVEGEMFPKGVASRDAETARINETEE